jgi:CheY-like chemotaxis protein
MNVASAVDEQPARDVMVVEDDFSIRETLRELLEDEGYRVSWAANGSEALTRLKAGVAPKVILLDLMMPVMDGWEFRSELRRDPTLADIPVVVISADHALEDKVAALQVDAVLAKPFPLRALLDTVRRYS